MSANAAPPERMSRVDHAWLRMDTDANLMMIVGVWLLAPRLAQDELARRVQASLLAYPRFRQKVVEDPMGAQWVEDTAFDLGHHVARETLRPKPGELPLEALKRRVAELCAQPLDPSRPLWQFHLIEDLDGTQSALVSRVHHCIGDGIALISVMLSIADGGKAPPQRKPRAAAEADDEHDWIADTLIKPFAELTIKAIGLTGQGMGKGLEMLAEPAGGLEVARLGRLLQAPGQLRRQPDDRPADRVREPLHPQQARVRRALEGGHAVGQSAGHGAISASHSSFSNSGRKPATMASGSGHMRASVIRPNCTPPP